MERGREARSSGSSREKTDRHRLRLEVAKAAERSLRVVGEVEGVEGGRGAVVEYGILLVEACV